MGAAETVGPEAAGAETAGSEAVGTAAVVFATGVAGCFRAKKRIPAVRTIAAAKTRIRVAEFALVGSFGFEDGGVTFAAGTESEAAGTVAACCRGACGAGGVVGVSFGGTVAGRTLLRATVLGIMAAATFWGGTSLGEIWLGKTGLGGTWLVVARGGSGTLGRGTWKITVAPLPCGGAAELSSGMNPSWWRRRLAIDKISPSVQYLAAKA